MTLIMYSIIFIDFCSFDFWPTMVTEEIDQFKWGPLIIRHFFEIDSSWASTDHYHITGE